MCWDESRAQWRKIASTSATSSPLSSTNSSLLSPPPPQSPPPPPPPPPSPPPHPRRHSSVPSELWLSRLRREWATVLSRIQDLESSGIWDPPTRIWTQSCEIIFCASCHIFNILQSNSPVCASERLCFNIWNKTEVFLLNQSPLHLVHQTVLVIGCQFVLETNWRQIIVGTQI